MRGGTDVVTCGVSPEEWDRALRATAHYDDLLETGFARGTSEHLAAHGEDHGGPYGDAQPPRVLRPFILTRFAYENVCRVAQALAVAVDIAAERLAEQPALRRELLIPEYLEPLIERDPSPGRSTIGRLDAFVDEAGWLKVIEYNTDPAIHGGVEANRAIAGAPIAAAFGRRYPFEWPNALDEAYNAVIRQHRSAGKRGTPVVAVLGLSGGIGEHPVFRWIPYVAARGCCVLAARAAELEFRAGRLYRDSVAVDQVIFAGWDDLLRDPEGCNDLFAAVRAGAVEIVNGLKRGMLAAYKSTFELLSNPRYRDWFSPDVARVLESAVPWTRVGRDARVDFHGQQVELLPFLSDRRSDFVIKPCGIGRGNGVVLGWQASREQWDRALKRQPGTWVVQERVRPRAQIFPVDDGHGLTWRKLVPDCCPYVWNGQRASSCLIRTSEIGRLQNVAAGGVRTGMWVLENET